VKHNKPCLHLYPGQQDAAQALWDFVADKEIATLNVAGPRASKEPQVGKFVKEVLEAAFPA
jgi:putative molybdenum carrier protein